MRRVIELGRNIRERKTISLKVPLRTFIVIHHDKQYLSDLESLKSYIIDELNIRDLVLTSDEAKFDVEYRAQADWPVLGKKLRKDIAKVKRVFLFLPVTKYKVTSRLARSPSTVLTLLRVT